MEKEIITYQERKENVYSWMDEQYHDDKPISYGSSYVFSELGNIDDVRLCEYFVACGLYELERNDLEVRIEEQMTYWIYQYKKGMFRDQILDKEILEKDIQKIESMIKLRFEDLECYEADK